jgi:hypothetical protein
LLFSSENGRNLPRSTERRNEMRRLWGFGLLIFFLAAVGMGGAAGLGCSSTSKEKRGETAKAETIKIERLPQGKYYQFEDVLVPKELNYKQNESFIYETPRFKAGSMVFTKWWLDSGSVIDFFSYHMEKDNWKLVNSYRGKESFMNFLKPDKSCTIRIVEKWTGMTEVEIRVGPLVEKTM